MKIEEETFFKIIITNILVMNLEILEKISTFLDQPMELSLCCKATYEAISSCRIKALWIKRNFNEIIKTLFLEKYVDTKCDKKSDVETSCFVVGMKVKCDEKKFSRFFSILNEPIFFNLVNMNHIPIFHWGFFAIENGYERSAVVLLKKYHPGTINSNFLIQLAMESCLQSRLSILTAISERLQNEQIQIPRALLLSTAKKFLEESDRDDFEYFQSGLIILKMLQLLPDSEEIRMEFLSEAIQFSLFDIRICLNILKQFDDVCLSDLNINWNIINEEKRFNDLIHGLASINKLLDRNGVVFQPLLEAAIMKDYTYSFSSLIHIGTNVPIYSLFHLAVMRNSIQCAKILISQDFNHIHHNGMLFLRNAIQFDNSVILSRLFLNYELIDFTEIMYYAIYCDAPCCLGEILKYVKSDQESLQRAITKIGRKRNSDGKTCLDLLLQSNENVLRAIEISNQAVRKVGNFVQMQHVS